MKGKDLGKMLHKERELQIKETVWAELVSTGFQVKRAQDDVAGVEDLFINWFIKQIHIQH